MKGSHLVLRVNATWILFCF